MSRSIDAFNLDPGKISARQLLFIIITGIISTADVFLPSIVATVAGRDSWISVIIATAEALVVGAVAVALALRYPKKTFVQVFQIVLGKWLGWLVAFALVIIFFLFVLMHSVGHISVILKVAFMQSTPLSAFAIVMVIISAYAVNQGIEVIARITELLLPLGIGMLILVGLLVAPQVDMGHFLPIMADGIGPVLRGAARILPFLGEVAIILILVPYLNEPQKLASTVTLSIVLLGGFLFVGVLAIGMFGVKQTANMTFPALEMVRDIEIGDFLEHLDAIIVTIWVSGIYIKTVVLYYVCCIGLAQLTGCSSYRPLIIPLGVVVIAGTLIWFYDIPGMVKALTYTWPSHGIAFIFLVPLTVLVVAAARGLKEKEE